MVKFKAKIWATGNGHVVTVPKTYITNKDVDPEKEYDVILQEANA